MNANNNNNKQIKTMRNAKRRINNVLKNLRQRRKRRLINLRVNKRLRRARLRARRALPVAMSTAIPKDFKMIRQDGTTAVVKGADLIYKIPDQISNQNANTNLITLIPANPSYWIGTRMAALAAGYQNYRPLQFSVHYVPQCAVTQQGNVLGGTLWNEVPTSDNLQQTLKTSNGGVLTQCYKPATSIIRMKSNLQFNLFRMGGAIDQESNPFNYIALAIGCQNGDNKIIPGWFYIRYTYMLKNPIGTGVTYSNTGLKVLEENPNFMTNAVAYLAAEITTNNNKKLGVGTRIDIEFNNSTQSPGYNYLYNNTPINKPTTPVWVLQNQQTTQAYQLVTRTVLQQNDIYFNSRKIDEDASVSIPPNEAILESGPNGYTTYLNSTDIPVNVTLEGTDSNRYYKIQNLAQDFGQIIQIVSGVFKFIGLLQEYRLLPIIGPFSFSVLDQQRALQKYKKLAEIYNQPNTLHVEPKPIEDTLSRLQLSQHEEEEEEEDPKDEDQ